MNNENEKFTFTEKDGLYGVTVDVQVDEVDSLKIKVERMLLFGIGSSPSEGNDRDEKEDLMNKRPAESPGDDGIQKRRQ